MTGSGKTGADADGERLESLERAVAVLQTFGRDHPALTLSEVARLTGMPRATARRILLTFRGLGHVASDGRVFYLTPKVLDLGWNYFASLGVDDIAKPIMEELVKKVDESCSMSTLDLPDIVYVARVHTRRIMTIGGGIGSRLPAHATAVGRVLLAGLDDAQLDGYLAARPLRRQTPRTVVDEEAFRTEIQRIRKRGWALIDQELEIGLRAIAVPVTSRDDRTVAGLSLSSNSARSTLADLRTRCLPPLREAATAVSKALAHGGHT